MFDIPSDVIKGFNSTTSAMGRTRKLNKYMTYTYLKNCFHICPCAGVYMFTISSRRFVCTHFIKGFKYYREKACIFTPSILFGE